MMLSAVQKEERSVTEEIVEQLLAANNQNPVAALHDAGILLLEIDAQLSKAESQVSAGFVRRKPSGG